MSDKPFRVQLSRQKGWRMPDNTVSVARPTRFGNPFSVREFGREKAIYLYRMAVCSTGWSPDWVAGMNDPQAMRVYEKVIALQSKLGGIERMRWVQADLRGKNLACWCPLDQPCHADVLLEIANA